MSDPFQHKPGRGSLFKNDYKTTENHPDAKGKIVAHRDIREGETLEIAAWTKTGSKGRFQSLELSDAWEAGPSSSVAPDAQEDDTVIPF